MPYLKAEQCLFLQAAYLAGLLLAFSARLWSNEGQPALLYIVPCMLGALGIAAQTRGQLRQWWQYKEESPTTSKLGKD